MFNALLKAIFGSSSDRMVRRLTPILDAVNSHEARYSRMTDLELRAQTEIFRARLGEGMARFRAESESIEEEDEYNKAYKIRLQKELDAILPEAFAVAREAAKRVVGMRPFDVQMIGGIVLHGGGIAEMVTGEGKTLVAVMPVYLNALAGRGVHVVTVNDYLARRDSEWMGPIYRFLGLTVGLIQQDMYANERQVGYRADITYGTNSEFGFDYLRDNMTVRPEDRVQRELNFAIVDEVDSILIDEARTPLIISGQQRRSTDLYYKVDAAVRQLRKEKHFQTEEKGHHVLLTDEGMETIERLMGLENLYSDESLGIVHMVEQSLRAHNFYKKDDEYIVREGEVLIVDEFTGRIMDGRRYSDGLHQAIEAKERVTVQFESQTIATISYQNYFKLYRKLAGMTGTAATEAMEFGQIYSLEVVQIPTNLPLIRKDLGDLIFATERGKFNAVIEEIERVHETGRPILVGTVSIEKSELVSTLLEERGVTGFQVLNAKHHEREASIVANAGKRGAITIATNMAGRGTDIKLAEGIREAGGLAIIGTERHESRRIDNQLRGRCGRQGDPGSSRFFISLEDDVARLFGGDRVKRMLDLFGGQEMDEEPLSQRMVSRTIERAQRQVEEYNFEIRKHLLEYDDVMNRQRKIIYAMRRDVLEDRDVTEQIHTMFENLVNDMVQEYTPEEVTPEEWNLEGLAMRFRQLFGFDPQLTPPDGREPLPLEEELRGQVLTEYACREASLAEEIRAAHLASGTSENTSIDYSRIARRRVHGLEMISMLRAADEKWIDHLYSMDYLRESVRLRAYGQKDPLVEYKSEGFEMFQAMMKTIDENVTQSLFRLTDPEIRRNREAQIKRGTFDPSEDPLAQLSQSQYNRVMADKTQDRSFAAFDTSRFALAGQPSHAMQAGRQQGGPREDGGKTAPKSVPVVRNLPKVNPNDKCPCGSGKKFKKCCGALAEN